MEWKGWIPIVFGMALGLSSGCGRSAAPGGSSGPIEITIAVSPQPVSAAVYVAQDKGFFAGEGLAVRLDPHGSGKQALAAAIEGRAQFATSAETPVMFAAMKGEPIRVIATIAESNKYMEIIGRKDRGITIPADLRGRRVGASLGTNGEFFLHVFLTLDHMTSNDVTVVNLAPGEMVGAMTEGRVDAVSAWDPITTDLKKALGARAAVIGDPTLYYTMTWNVVATKASAERDQAVTRSVLRALVAANDFMKAHPDEAEAVVAGHVGMSEAALQETWHLYSFDVGLDQSLILNLEDQARWLIRSEKGRRKIPNFAGFIDAGALSAIRPDAITLAGY